MMKMDVDLRLAYRLLHPRNVVLVSCVDMEGKSNIITLAWLMPTSMNPPMVAISIAPRYSHQLIQETKEFVVNIPSMDILRETLLCGRITGRKHDKFAEAKLTPSPAKLVKPAIISECAAHLECSLSQTITTGDHTMFVGTVIAAYANEGVFKEGKFDFKLIKPVLHLGGDDFMTLNPEIITLKTK